MWLSRWLRTGVSDESTLTLTHTCRRLWGRCHWCWTRIVYERWRSSSNPSLNDQLHYPVDIYRYRTLNETVADKVLQYRDDYNNRPSHTIVFIPVITSTSGWLHCEFVCLLFLQDHQETDRFLASSGVHLVQIHFHFHLSVFSSQLKSKVDHILVKSASLQIMLNIDGEPIVSRSHVHPSHTQNSRLLTSYLSL